jgi:Tol biopolymer transport system component
MGKRAVGQRAGMVDREEQADREPVAGSMWPMGDTRRLTGGTGSDAAAAWSPDGRRIAFVSKRGEDEMAALYVIPVDGGEAEKLVELPWGVAAPAWLPDGKGIVFAHPGHPRTGRHVRQGRPRGDEEGSQAPQGLEDDGVRHRVPAIPLLRPQSHRQPRQPPAQDR